MLGLFIYLWPLIVIMMLVASIVGMEGFNGFTRVHHEFSDGGNKAVGAFGIIISLVYLGLSVLSSYLYYRIFRERSILTKLLL
jgi:hypothetical protein